MGRKVGKLRCPPFWKIWVPIQKQNVACVQAYLPIKLHLDPSSRLATTDMGRKLGDCAVSPLSGRGRAGSPSNTTSPGPRRSSVPSGILIHPAVWPQYTNVTDRTDRTGLDTVDRQRSNSTRRTVLQTVARKRLALCYCTVVCPVCPVLSSSHGKGHSSPPPIDPCRLWPNCRPSQQLPRPLVIVTRAEHCSC